METNSKKVKRRKKRRRKVAMANAGIVAAIAAVIIGGCGIYNQIPSVKVDKYISKAKEYEEVQDYENAMASYEEALKIESTTVKTYQYMANLYLDMEDYEGARKILFRGMEETGDSQIQDSYETVMLNESVLELNEDKCSFLTVERCLEVLSLEPGNIHAYEILETCYERLCKKTTDDGNNMILALTETGFGYEAYETVINKMISLYELEQNPKLKELLLNFIGIQAENVWISMGNYKDYLGLVEKVDSIVTDDKMENLKACLEKSVEIRELFAPILKEFEEENYKVARDFLVSEEYVAIRDEFINETMEYWEGKTYIPVSNIGIKLHYSENGWKFSFVDEENQAAEYGYIKVWGFKWLDNGHQRTAITYVPVSETKEYYPLTEYTMMYWWSTPINMEVTENTYARMNFRFEENRYTEEGKTTKAINDWGGKYEYRDIYE